MGIAGGFRTVGSAGKVEIIRNLTISQAAIFIFQKLFFGEFGERSVREIICGRVF